MLSITVQTVAVAVNPSPVIFHATYRDYTGELLAVNPVTGRALVNVQDDILDGGGQRELWLNLADVEVLR